MEQELTELLYKSPIDPSFIAQVNISINDQRVSALSESHGSNIHIKMDLQPVVALGWFGAFRPGRSGGRQDDYSVDEGHLAHECPYGPSGNVGHLGAYHQGGAGGGLVFPLGLTVRHECAEFGGDPVLAQRINGCHVRHGHTLYSRPTELLGQQKLRKAGSQQKHTRIVLCGLCRHVEPDLLLLSSSSLLLLSDC